MKRRELIAALDEIREEIALCTKEELTDRAREQAYMCIVSAMDFLKENDD